VDGGNELDKFPKPDLQGIRDARLVMVTGKGGTGKSTTAAGLARLLAADGKRVCLAELDSQRAAITPIFGQEPTFAPVEVMPRLWVMNITWPESLVAWLRTMIPVGRIVKAILANETVRQFLDFTPGSREIVALTVIQELQRRFDVETEKLSRARGQEVEVVRTSLEDDGGDEVRAAMTAAGTRSGDSLFASIAVSRASMDAPEFRTSFASDKASTASRRL